MLTLDVFGNGKRLGRKKIASGDILVKLHSVIGSISDAV
jgi:hypothetical protein